jgi:putative FmdB family regulatory protein
MPIYEFYCFSCHKIYNFFSSSVNTEKRPACPGCGSPDLERQLSLFSSPKKRGEQEDAPLPDLDEAKMEKAMGVLAQEAEGLDENDPRQAANLMRRLTEMTGLKLGGGMEDALRRMEAGEDPEQIEAEMGGLLESEEPFELQSGGRKGRWELPPDIDDTLYEL